MNQLMRFLAVGVFNTLLGYCIIFACMYLVGLGPEASNAAGYTVGLSGSYVLNRYYTFESVQNQRREFLRFLAVFLVAYASNFAFLLFLIYKTGMHEGVSQIFAGIVYVVASFLMNKYYVFKIPNPR